MARERNVHGTIETGLPVSQRSYGPWVVPAAFALLITAILAVGLTAVSWAFQDVYNFFYRATTLSWRETIGFAFSGDVIYRPLLIVLIKLVHQLVGLRLWVYHALVVLQFAASLLVLLWLLRPATWQGSVAACIALACAIGLHTSRVLFMFMPLNGYSLVLVMLLSAVGIAMAPWSRAREWVFLPLTLVAMFVLESGAIIPVVLVVLWRMGAPTATGRGVAGAFAAVAIYIVVRQAFGAHTALTAYEDSGLGFADVDAERLSAVFAKAPWMLWIYNVVASVLTVVASEPRGGRYLFIERLLHANVPMWMYLHVFTSVLTTALIVVVLARRRLSGARDRQLAGAGLTLFVVGSALGFLYTRDRIALFAGFGYALLIYVSVTALLEGWRTSVHRVHRAALAACIVVITTGWLIRTGEAYFQLRDTAWEHRQEWTARYAEMGGSTLPRTDLLLMLRSRALSRTPPDPRRDPTWTYVLFEREFEPVPGP